ncbi:MAG TPA: hypothetical protein VJN93_12085 [Candidatus Acidoferrum sp.]|nr:hypothetical protein [Candidatus Acidoferrum sp.]
MRTARWICAGTLSVLLAGSGMIALAQGNGKGKGKGHNKHDDDRGEYYRDHDRDEARGWYDGHEGHLPPGLAKKDRLPPGLERQLVRNGRLPPGLQKRIEPCPPELVRVLPPPPPDCAHVLIAGHIVLLNRHTNVVVDIIHFD